MGLARTDGLSVGAHAQRQRRSDKPGQSLSSRRARDDPEQDFGLADLRVGSRHAVVAGHRDFIAAPQRIAVNGGHDRLRTVFDTPEQRVRGFGAGHRIGGCPERVEHLDVCARNERVAGADEHDTVRGVVARGTLHGCVDAFPDGRAEGVDRRIVNGYDSDTVDDFVTDDGRHTCIIIRACTGPAGAAAGRFEDRVAIGGASRGK
jgi:hypothetical protein